MLNKELPQKHIKILNSLGMFLKELRTGEGMTREEVCNETKMHIHTLMRIERNESGYNIVHILELADFYGVPPKELLEFAE